MASPSFVVRLADLERGAKEVSFPISEAWLRDALKDSDATPRGGDGSLTVELMKNGREVMVRGQARVAVNVPCVVTLEPLPFELTPEIFLLLQPEAAATDRKQKAAVGSDRRPERPSARAEKPAPARPETDTPKKKKRRRANEDPELPPEVAAQDTYRGEEIVLDEFVREFILLEIPPYPRRSDLPSGEEGISSRPLAGPAEEKPVDPRLAPLASLAARLRGDRQ